jgi:hypothetical protein
MASLAKADSGPKTPEGLAIVTKNLDNVDREELKKRYRFNAMKHGLYSEVATTFPAKPGRYPECETCAWALDCRAEVEADGMLPLKERAIFIPCKGKLELFMLHAVAFENKDPSVLTRLNANLQAKIRALIDQMIHAIVRDGVALKTPQWYTDKETGEVQLMQYVDPDTGRLATLIEVEAHPLLSRLTDLIARNHMALADMGMTPKIQEEEQLIRGHLDHEATRGDEMLEFQRKQAESTQKLLAFIQNSQRGPVTIDQKSE